MRKLGLSGRINPPMLKMVAGSATSPTLSRQPQVGMNWVA